MLKRVNLCWNGFGPVSGAQELGKALRVNAVLEELDVSYAFKAFCFYTQR